MGEISKINRYQSRRECRDKLIGITNRWEMDDSDGSTMRIDADDEFMSVLYSAIRLLSD